MNKHVDIKTLNKKSYTDLIMQFAKGEVFNDSDSLVIGNLTFTKVSGISNYVNGATVLNVYVNKMLCEYDHKEHENLLFRKWLDLKNQFADTYQYAKQDMLKSDEDTVYYISAGTGELNHCSRDRWY